MAPLHVATLTVKRELPKYEMWLFHIADLLDLPLCLRIRIPLKYDSSVLILGVDPRIGNIVASVEPACDVGGVSVCLEELEKVVTSTWSTLPGQLAKLQ